MDQVEGEGSQAPKRLLTLPRAQRDILKGWCSMRTVGCWLLGRNFGEGKDGWKGEGRKIVCFFFGGDRRCFFF